MIFNYHQITTRPDSYLYSVSAAQLEEHLNAITTHQPALPFQITFDDGHATQLQNGVPVLQKYGCPAIFFVTVGWVNVAPDYFTWNDVRELQRLGYTVGTHGWSHKFLTQCSTEELDRELCRSRKALEDCLGVPVTTLSFPGGRFSPAILNACREAGYSAVYTSNAWITDTASAMKVYGRMVITRNMTQSKLIHFLNCGGQQPLVSQIVGAGKATAKKLMGDKLYYRIWSFLTHNPRLEGIGNDPVE